MINFALLAASAYMLIFLNTSAYTEAILLSAVIVAGISNRKNINALHLSVVLFVIISVETCIQASQVLIPNSELANVWKNTIIYSTYLVFDAIALCAVIMRTAISRTLKPSEVSSIHITRSEILLISVYALFIIVNILALGENFIRNLEHLGLSESFASKYWAWDWVYYNYSTLKRVVIALQLFSILMLVREAREIRAQTA
ncbi:hypothetical protein [Pseudoalteromonas aurantia]|uniref:Uncharacterized protein n=1 Tax=Pseudoalteromonas aurantia TaxID=43654 RepID=A0A5S3V1X5_9GAMM|nr:hypothetical protein [Pseudoalteromonas aurantia]TMO64446.1 hypothetical protein CWC19_18420 [Pseudoalteromonas aurantia]